MTDRDKYFFDGMKRGDSKVIEKVIKEFGAIAIAYVNKNSGSRDDGKEFLLVTITDMWKWLNKPGNEPYGSIEAFFRKVLHDKWLDELNRRKRVGSNLPENIPDDELADECEEYCYQLFILCFSRLGERCIASLELYLEGVQGTEAWKLLGFPAQNTLNQHNYNCRQQLIQCVTENNKNADCKCISQKN